MVDHVGQNTPLGLRIGPSPSTAKMLLAAEPSVVNVNLFVSMCVKPLVAEGVSTETPHRSEGDESLLDSEGMKVFKV